MVALRPGRPASVRAAAWVAALATFGWIVSVAITKDPLGFSPCTALDPRRPAPVFAAFASALVDGTGRVAPIPPAPGRPFS